IRKAVELARKLNRPATLDELRNLAASALALPDFHTVKSWDGWPEGSQGLAFDDTALRLYARGDRDGNLSVRRTDDGEEVARLPGAGKALSIRFARDGRTLYLHDPKEGAFQRWRIGARRAEKVATLPGQVLHWGQSHDGRRLLLLRRYKDSW